MELVTGSDVNCSKATADDTREQEPTLSSGRYRTPRLALIGSINHYYEEAMDAGYKSEYCARALKLINDPDFPVLFMTQVNSSIITAIENRSIKPSELHKICAFCYEDWRE